MLENVTPKSPTLFFISRFFILAGMVLFFMSVFYGIGITICKYLFDVDIMADPSILYNYNSNPDVLKAVKFLQVFSSIGLFVIPAWYFPKAIQQDSKTFLQITSGFSLKNIGLGIGILIISTPFISWLVYANESIVFPASLAQLEQQLKTAELTAQQLTQAFIKTDSFAGLMINMIIVALVPAICEELLFRGALQQFIAFCFRNRHAAVWSTALIFSAFHGQFYGFFPRLILGAMLGYMFIYSGSLWVSVIVHFINNALALLANYYKWNEGTIDFLKEDYVFPVYVNVLSFALSVGAIYLMYLYRKKKIWYNGE